ncbi:MULTISPECIES: hypothetical protein [unclassified Lysobacter]|uniref:hypothetical protein n=1 Tax=unclassified Lysobacter TaxID=2635362 RepID=UPI001BE6E7E6|nr:MULTISPECIES: hypothetical protein [unclassified Lysobacter]MBT2746061.1 hypothetical protein [Lysobacter sp. ISL-42]MBT2752496.1 hypothetical protein [Lysobacter sp. ISL-50]MBT2776775.1 hypothetical protein [Lysobacter sp. ISL-54]MBT2780657.1 hypothetical protein [Lysobacter sp. ISL-52]
MAIFSVHFDGAITTRDHKVSIRVLANTYEHMQRAIDRSYLINKHGQVWKHARLKGNEYAETEFIAEYPREGGIILDAAREGAEAIIDRIAAAVIPLFEASTRQGVQLAESVAIQYQDRIAYVENMGRDTQTFESLLDDPPDIWSKAYSSRSIVKEIDPLVSVIAHDENSCVDLRFVGSNVYQDMRFSPIIAQRFHAIASNRQLAAPVIVRAKIRVLDRGNKRAMPSAKIENIATGREVSLHLQERADFDVLHPYHDGREVLMYASPLTEALGFDLYGGDLVFLDLVG